jgi:hypothetical protein
MEPPAEIEQQPLARRACLSRLAPARGLILTLSRQSSRQSQRADSCRRRHAALQKFPPGPPGHIRPPPEPAGPRLPSHSRRIALTGIQKITGYAIRNSSRMQVIVQACGSWPFEPAGEGQPLRSAPGPLPGKSMKCLTEMANTAAPIYRAPGPLGGLCAAESGCGFRICVPAPVCRPARPNLPTNTSVAPGKPFLKA